MAVASKTLVALGALCGLTHAEILREDFSSMADLQKNWEISTWASTKDTVVNGQTRKDTIKAYKTENVSVNNGQLVLKVNASPAGVYPKCGEVIYTPRKFLYGSYRASIKTTNVPGSVIGWFVYKDGAPGDGQLHEVDFEILTRQPKKMWFTLHHDVYNVDSKTYDVSFNPYDAFHEYRFDWYKDSVVYYIDSQRVSALTKQVPDDSTAIMLNHWSANIAGWGGAAPTSDTYMYIDYMEYRSLDELNKTTPTIPISLQAVDLRQDGSVLKWSSIQNSELSISNASGQELQKIKGQGRQSLDLSPYQGQKLYVVLRNASGVRNLIATP